MGRRFKEKGAYLSSFVAPESAFIDIMMNVGIVFYAARETDDEALYDIALQHCLTSRRYLVRGDGSAVHEGIFDLETGAFLRESTHQGWRHDTSWARGLSWAIYGFGAAYSFSRDPRLLQTARHCADYYILNTPAQGVCPNDWLEPSPPVLTKHRRRRSHQALCKIWRRSSAIRCARVLTTIMPFASWIVSASRNFSPPATANGKAF